MKRIRRIYKVRSLPATTDVILREIAGGNIGAATVDAYGQFMDILACIHPSSVTLENWYEFLPARTCGSRQRPPQVDNYLIVSSTSKSDLKALDTALEEGPLQTYYGYTKIKTHRVSLKRFRACAVVCRKEDLVRPGVSREHNPGVPNDHYYYPKSLRHQDGNGLLALDQTICRLTEPFLIRMAFNPAEIDNIRSALASLLRLTRAINQTWRNPEDDPGQSHPLLDDSSYPTAHRYFPSSIARTQDLIADTIGQELQRVYESLFKPCLRFNIQVWARTTATAQMVGAIVASSLFQPGCYRIMTFEEGQGEFFEKARHAAESGKVLAIPTHDAFPATMPPFRYRQFESLATIGSVEDLISAVSLPVANSRPLVCFRKSTSPPPLGDNDILFGYDDVPSSIIGKRVSWKPYGISPKDLLMHLAILGMSGSGKSNTKEWLRLQCIERGWPFLSLELAKTEGRNVKILTRHPDPKLRAGTINVEIFTPGIECLSPLRLNLFDLFPDVERTVLVDIIARIFLAAFAMAAPMPELFREGLGRLLLGQCASSELTLANLLQAVSRVMDTKNYCGELSGNLRGALETRLNSLQIGALGSTFLGTRSIPDIAHLATSQTIMELHILQPEQAAFIVFLLSNALYHYFLTHANSSNDPRFIIFIEELHVIAGPDSSEHPSESHVNTKGYAASTLERLLCELRALKVGLCLINQAASALPFGIFKNIGTLIAHTQKEEKERAFVAQAMNLTDDQAVALSLLEPGQAFLRAPHYPEPVRIWTPNMDEVMNQCQL